MQPDGYIDYILNEEKKPLFVGSNGLVQEGDPVTLLKPDGQPARLQFAPDGWKDSMVKYGRNLTWMALFREMTVPLKFTKDGAKIMRYLRFNKGQEAVAYYAKLKLDRQAFPHSYYPWFVGEPDFTKFRKTRTGVTITTMEGGLSKLLKANENTTFDIPINTDPDKQILYLDGVPFTNSVEWVVYSGQNIPGGPGVPFRWLGMGVMSQEGTTQGIIVQDVQMTVDASFPNNSYFLWSVNKTISAHITGRITGNYQGTGGGSSSNLILRITKAKFNAIIDEIIINTGGPYGEGDFFNVNIDETMVVGPEERLYIRIGVIPDTVHPFYISGSNIKVEYEVTFDPTQCECLKPITLYERIVEKLTKGKYGVKSDFLNGLDDLLYSSGPALRKYQSDASIKTSLMDLFQDLKTKGKKKYSIGLGIENDKLVIEELDYFFRSEVIMDLGIVNDLEIYDATDIQINTIKVGYRNQNIDKVNGRDEVNVTQQYTTPHTRTVKELDLVSPYRFDMYGIEVTRIDLFGKDTTDNKADNDTFGFCAEKQPNIDVLYYSGAFATEINTGAYYIKIPVVLGAIANGLSIVIAGSGANDGVYTVENTSYIVVGYTVIKVTEAVTNESIVGTLTSRNSLMWNLLRPAYTTVTGVLHPDEVFNTEASPKRGLLNNGGYLHSLLDWQDINKIEFVNGEKNSELLTTIGGVTIEEKAPVVIGSLPAKLFLPYYFKFTTRVPINFIDLMKINPYGRIKFTDGETGQVLYGYMWDGGINPEPEDKQEWILISAPNNDMTKLI